MQEIYAKEETFRISSSSTSEEDHEARQESRHAMNMTPNDLRTSVVVVEISFDRFDQVVVARWLHLQMILDPLDKRSTFLRSPFHHSLLCLL
jgi:hypothetical protein